MSNQTVDEALDTVLKAAGTALKNYSMALTLDKMRDAMRKAMSDSYIAGSNACADILQESRSREAELLAEIERLKSEHDSLLHCSKQAIKDLTEELDSLKAKVSEHNDACLQGCSKTSGDNHCGYAGYDRDCTTCPKDHMIDLGEHHE